ncbi:hypothetical protein [Pseudomonas veronii]
MDNSERNFRDTPTTSRKYLKRLTDYITKLLDSGRNLEAHHFFLELCKINPFHEKTIRLGYSIAISLFDNDGVSKYDKLLADSTPDINELLWFQLRYYHSQNNNSACERVSCELLKKMRDKNYLPIIIEVCIERKSYVIAEHLVQFLAKNRLTLRPPTDTWLLQIVITKLLETFWKYR